MIDLYYWPTPNGWKVSIMLAELDIDGKRLAQVPAQRGRGLHRACGGAQGGKVARLGPGKAEVDGLTPQHGKAAAFQEKSRGLQDAGATVACFIITTMSTFVNAA